MSVLGLNRRAAGGDATVRELRDLTKCYSPSILCILETQLPKKRVLGLSRSLGFHNCFVVSSL
jgi:hypothetical protein